MEDNDFARVGSLMRAVDPPPGSLDVASLVDTGRRSERRRQYGAATAVGGLTAIILVGAVGAVTLTGHDGGRRTATASHAAATTSLVPRSTPIATPPDNAACSVQLLPNPGGGVVGNVTAGDPTGRFAGGDSAVRDQAGPLVLWTNGVPKVIHVPASVGAVSEVKSINSRGDFVFLGGGRHTTSWLYHDGTTTALHGLPGTTDTAAEGINAKGDIVGSTDDAAGDGGPAAIWPADHPGSVRKLATPHGGPAMAFAIDDAGTIVGSLGDGQAPYMWNANGQGHKLTVPSGYHGGKAFAVSGDWAVGWVGVGADGQVAAARWNLRTGMVDVYPDLDEALAVDAHGDFVGSYESPYLFRDGVAKPLPGAPGVTSTYPIGGTGDVRDISTDGKTIFGNVNTSKATLSAVWHC